MPTLGVVVLVFQAPLTEALAGSAPVEALLWIACALAVLSGVEGVDRLVRRRAAVR